MSAGMVDKVYIGLDNAPAAFDIKTRILGPNGTNLEYIRSETGVVATLKGDKFEPLHLVLQHTRPETLAQARSLAQNLIETIRAELTQWSAQNSAQQNLNVTSLNTTIANTVTLTTATITAQNPPPLTPITPVMQPAVTMAPAAPLMTVRPQTVLQLLPQQQYVLNQENGQFIPIVQPGVQVSNPNFTSLPIAQPLGALQQSNFGTQLVDISNMQPTMSVMRLSSVPSSMPMILPNGLSFPQVSLAAGDTTTVSSALSTPVVCAAQNVGSAQKIVYSTDKGDKDVRYHIQGADTMQWAMPGSQTMLIPYQQFQDLSSQGLTNIQPQQFVSIATPSGLTQTSLPLNAAQLQHFPTSGTMHIINQKSSTPTKTYNVQEGRGQKRLADGTPSQLQLRPIAPAGTQAGQDKSTRDARFLTQGKDNTVVSMGMKINPSHGTIIHVSSGQQTNLASHDGTGVHYIRQIKDGQKQEPNKMAGAHAQNVQMITVPQGMTVLQNPLNIGPVQSMLGQSNGQVYMLSGNQPNLMPGVLPHGLIGQQVLQPGQNVTVMPSNQVVSNGVQYSMPIMPMNIQPNQCVQGLSLNSHLSSIAGQQLPNTSLNVAGAIPIVQSTTPAGESHGMSQIMPQVPPTSQYAAANPQYVVQENAPPVMPAVNANVQYSLPNTQNTATSGTAIPTSTPAENESPNPPASQQSFMPSQDSNYNPTTQAQSFNAENAPPAQFAAVNQNLQNYESNISTSTENQSYAPTETPTSYAPASNPQASAQNFPQAPANSQSAAQTQIPMTMPSQSQNYPLPNAPSMPSLYAQSQTAPNPYPNATGQVGAYPNGQYYQPNRPWFRPRYGAPQNAPYNSGVGPPQGGATMNAPQPTGNYDYWTEN